MNWFVGAGGPERRPSRSVAPPFRGRAEPEMRSPQLWRFRPAPSNPACIMPSIICGAIRAQKSFSPHEPSARLTHLKGWTHETISRFHPRTRNASRRCWPRGLRALPCDSIFVPATVDDVVIGGGPPPSCGRRASPENAPAGGDVDGGGRFPCPRRWLSQLIVSRNRPLARGGHRRQREGGHPRRLCVGAKDQAGEPARLDLNGDGVSDRSDVDVIAARAVRLGGGV
jgi:hypothetical protein